MSLRINDIAPDFTAQTTQGTIRFHEWIGDSYAILFSHPKDFTPVCTTELGEVARHGAGICQAQHQGHRPERGPGGQPRQVGAGHRRNAGPHAALSDDWRRRPERGQALQHAAGGDVASDGRTAATNATVRSVFIIGPDKKIKMSMTYPMTSGRNFAEILRVLESIQLTAKYKVATPVNWQNGDDVIIVTSVSDDEAKTMFPAGFKTLKPYLRTTKQPG